jgi:hypothetical protein
LAEAFSPRQSYYTPSLYHSPSNPFCRRRLFHTITPPARRLDYAYARQQMIPPLISWCSNILKGLPTWAKRMVQYETIAAICFWAVVVIMLTSTLGFNTLSPYSSVPVPSVQGYSMSHSEGRSWKNGEYHDYLEGIWAMETKYFKS